MSKKHKPVPEPILAPCAWTGCPGQGEYRAPKSRGRLREYMLFCLDHVRQYNQSWDYFSGMSDAEVEQFQKEALYGHHPTWKMGVKSEQRAAHLNQKILEELAQLQGVPYEKPKAYNPLPLKEREALALFGLDYPVTLKDIKKRYKELVKRYHPDINDNDKAREEQFKAVSKAYKLLKDSGLFE